MSDILRFGLYGINGHQIHGHLDHHPRARFAAVAGIPEARLTEAQRADTSIRRVDSLDAMLAMPDVDAICLCSPRRADQFDDALRALAAGKHVYAEKPCALNEADLDRLMAAAAASGKIFHEMAGSAFSQPYWAMGQVVRSGVLGQVIQIFAQKSYPWFASRPQDEALDGGLTVQAGVHAYRWLEHVAGERIVDAVARETRLGNDAPGGQCRRASSVIFTLESGALASVVVNYLNQPGLGSWGNEHLRIFGTKGFVECRDGGAHTRLVVGEEDRGPLDVSEPAPDFFDMIVAEILDGTPFPFTLAEELHPTRAGLMAKASADAAGPIA